MPKEKNGLNFKEKQVFEIIKNAAEPVTSNDIMKTAPELNKNAVQPALRTLLKMGLIEVFDTVVDRNILSRRFVMTKEAPKIIGDLFFEEFKTLQRLADTNVLLTALITTKKGDTSGKADLEDLKKMIDSYKKGN